MAVIKRLLDEGEKEIVISGLGYSVDRVASVADILCTSGYCKVTKLRTSRVDEQDEDARRDVGRLQVWVVKTPEFKELYEVDKEKRAARLAAREEQ
eukprot:CAMPEP_0201492240 /NCGR_PEP_ID=MMETSP0151_2-20130828/32363_1 /ASSEMBLY_ACC=CAM_ASM_000257 /TAXON_ID=200890 /ORGANISM="Paramoeba atlantica, Strain 621/1 / CCAP 1560/9" /LENGTH=95 /DNA_ID=CAMNT_0047878953 /DNA_START=114 /DNA_END=401 /DNA_ORIENTATION=+